MKKPPYLFTGLLTLAAIFYNSWPLGYFLDNSTARLGFASDLEDPNHPYAWVFIACDVVTALFLMGLSLYLHQNRPMIKLKYVWTSLCIGLILFGFFTGFGAAAPDQCHVGVSACFRIFNKDLSIDGAETSLAAFGLLVVLLSSALLTKPLDKIYKLLSWGIFGLWFILGFLLIHGLLIYANVHFIQQVFLILCGFGLVVVGLNLDRLYRAT